MAQCDALIREHGHGCCDSCFEEDTHGLLDKFKVIDVADHAQELQNLTRIAAQTVIGFGEHAKAIRTLRAETAGLIQENALLRGRIQELEQHEAEALVDTRVKARLLKEVMAQVRTVVARLPERVKELEDVATALEIHLGLQRRPKASRDQPGPMVEPKKKGRK